MNKRLKLLFVFLLTLPLLRAQDAILLNLPFDEDTIYTKFPVLSWSILGSLPVDSDRDYYQITVVELLEQQDAASGVLLNTPLVRREHLTQQQLIYPYDAPSLQYGKRYGWQVQKVMNNAVVDQSEAWEFTLHLPILNQPIYHKLKFDWDGVVYDLQDGKLYFELLEAYNDNEVVYRLFNSNNLLISSNVKRKTHADDPGELNAKSAGTNQYVLQFSSPLPLGIYRLEVDDAKRKTHLIYFNVQ